MHGTRRYLGRKEEGRTRWKNGRTLQDCDIAYLLSILILGREGAQHIFIWRSGGSAGLLSDAGEVMRPLA